MEMVPVVQTVFSGISTLIEMLDKLKSSKGNYPVENLKLSTYIARSVLKSVGEFQLQGNEISALERQALKTLTKWCYDAENFVERKEMTEPMKNSTNKETSARVKKLWDRLAGPDQILAACTKINEMAIKCEKFSKQNQDDKVVPHPYVGTNDAEMLDTFIGRDDNIKEIMKLLSDECKEDGVSIVGMCGIGKSSLAQRILKDADVKQFRTLWVDVPNGVFVWGNIKNQIEDSVKEISDDERLKLKLLIVFDNLQHVGNLEWHKFHEYKKPKPIKMIITTRNPTIPDSTCTIPHELGFLSDECCRKVIEKYTSHYCTEPYVPRYRRAIESSIKKCEGLPLGAKMFGMIIGKCMYKNKWDAFEGVERLWQEPGFRKEIFPMILSSSYQGMELELWRCVAYLSLFPVGHQFDLEDLVHLWVGEGFIPSEASSTLKQIRKRKRYIDDLLHRSIIIQQQCSEKEMQTPHSTTEDEEKGSGKVYRLHSYGEEFASIASLETCLRLDPDVQQPYAWDMNPRHLSFFYNSKFSYGSENLADLRTFMSLYDKKNFDLHLNVGKIFKASLHLRVLSLKGTNVEVLPREIFNLIFLRYFDISFTPVKELSKEINRLSALKFLKLKGCDNLELPDNFYELENLLHVEWEETFLRKNYGGGLYNIGKLSRLECLPFFKVGNKKGFFISELKLMNNLQGSLCISDLQKIKSAEDAKKAELDQKRGLRTIKLHWINSDKKAANKDSCENILYNLKPHGDVKNLEIHGGTSFPKWIRDSMLVNITLTGCNLSSSDLEDFFPILGKLKFLESLQLNHLKSTLLNCRFEDEVDKNCFPSLESLRFSNMRNLKTLSNLRNTDMLRLQNFQIESCKYFDSLPSLDHLTLLKSLIIDNEDLHEFIQQNMPKVLSTTKFTG